MSKVEIPEGLTFKEVRSEMNRVYRLYLGDKSSRHWKEYKRLEAIVDTMLSEMSRNRGVAMFGEEES
jgi:hypothetical protein